MIKTALTICGALCALTPTLACIQPPNAEQEQLSEARYSSDFEGGEFDRTTVVGISYSNRVRDEYVNPYRVPTFAIDGVATCTIDAGGNAIGYFDRSYGDLIPGYSATTFMGKFTYGKQNAAVDKMFSELYDYMGCTQQGTTIRGFKNGMTAYVNKQGYNIELPQATGNYNNINYEYLKEQLRQEKLAVIFLNNYSIVASDDFSTSNGYDEVRYNLYKGNHAMLVYGYRDYYYYDVNGGLIEQSTYLNVYTDNASIKLAYLDISRFCNVDDIYIVDIQ